MAGRIGIVADQEVDSFELVFDMLATSPSCLVSHSSCSSIICHLAGYCQPRGMSSHICDGASELNAHAGNYLLINYGKFETSYREHLPLISHTEQEINMQHTVDTSSLQVFLQLVEPLLTLLTLIATCLQPQP